MRDIRSSKIVALAAAALSLVLAATVGAQTPPGTNPRLSLSIGSGAPEAETELTLKLASVPGVAIGRLDVEVTFPAEALRFDRVAGYLVTEGLLEVDSRLGDPVFGSRTLFLTLQSAKTGGLVPGDMQVDLLFTVAKETKPGVLDVSLKGTVLGPDGQPIEPVDLYGGRINIQEAEVFYACFFYMH